MSNYWTPPTAGAGWFGILLRIIAASPFCNCTDTRVMRWAMVSPSSCPVCSARGKPSFLNFQRTTNKGSSRRKDWPSLVPQKKITWACAQAVVGRDQTICCIMSSIFKIDHVVFIDSDEDGDKKLSISTIQWGEVDERIYILQSFWSLHTYIGFVMTAVTSGRGNFSWCLIFFRKQRKNWWTFCVIQYIIWVKMLK